MRQFQLINLLLSNLLPALAVHGDGDSLERLVAALRAELLVHAGSGVEAGVAPQDPGLRFPDHLTIVRGHQRVYS